MLAKCFSVIRDYVFSVFFAKKVYFLPPKHASRCCSKEYSQNYSQGTFDGDSIVSQSRFDAYVIQGTGVSMATPDSLHQYM